MQKGARKAIGNGCSNIYVFKHPWISRPTTFRVFTIWTMEPIPPVEFGWEWILECAKGSWGRIVASFHGFKDLCLTPICVEAIAIFLEPSLS